MMPQNRNSAPAGETQVYPVGKFKNPAFKSILVCLGVVLLVAGLSAHLSHQDMAQVIDRFKFQIAYMASLILLTLYTMGKAEDRLPSRFETTPEGIARVDRYGHKLFIAWPEIEKITHGRGLAQLGVVASGGRGKMFIPGHMEGFGELSKRILEEYQSRQKKDATGGRFFSASRSGKIEYVFATLFLGLFALMGPVALVGMEFSKEGTVKMSQAWAWGIALVGTLGFGAGAIYFAKRTIALFQTQIRLDDLGVTQKNRTGKETGIPWGEIGRLTENSLSQELWVTDFSGSRKIIVSSGLEGFREIEERVCREYMGRLAPPPRPYLLGKKKIWKPVAAMVPFFTVCCFLTFLVFFRTNRADAENFIMGLIMVFLIWGMFAFAVAFVSLRVDQAEMGGEGIALDRWTGRALIPWGDLDRVEWYQRKDAMVNVPYFDLRLLTRSGKTYRISGDLDFRLRFFTFASKGK